MGRCMDTGGAQLNPSRKLRTAGPCGSLAVSPGQTDFDSLAVGIELTEEELQQFARGLVVIAGYV
jgi:hypothetical protein